MEIPIATYPSPPACRFASYATSLPMNPISGDGPNANGSGFAPSTRPAGLTSPSNSTVSRNRCAVSPSIVRPVKGSVEGLNASQPHADICTISGNTDSPCSAPSLPGSVRRTTASPTASVTYMHGSLEANDTPNASPAIVNVIAAVICGPAP